MQFKNEKIVYKCNVGSVMSTLPLLKVKSNNATPVQILDNALRELSLSATQKQTKYLEKYNNILEVLKQLNIKINFTSSEPCTEVEALKAALKSLNLTNFTESQKAKLNIYIQKFMSSLNNIRLSKDDINYLCAAQKRHGSQSLFYETEIDNLGVFLNYFSEAILDIIMQDIEGPNLDNTVGSNFISLSTNSLILQQAKYSIRDQRKLSYVRFVNTHQLVDFDQKLEGHAIDLTDYFSDLNAEDAFKLYTSITKDTITPGNINWFTLGKLPWRIVGGRDAFIKDYNQALAEKKRFKQLLMNLQSFVIATLSIVLNTFVFVTNLLIAAVFFSYDTVASILGLIFLAPFLGTKESFKLAHTLAWFQRKAQEAQIDTLTSNITIKDDLKNIIKKPLTNLLEDIVNVVQHFVAEFNKKSAKPSLWERLKLMWTFSKQDSNIMEEVNSSFENNIRCSVGSATTNVASDNAIHTSGEAYEAESSQDDTAVSQFNIVKPMQALDAIITARSPSQAPVEVLLLLSNDLIGSWRARYKWPSSLASCACLISLGYGVILPTAFLAKMQLSQIGQYCQLITSNIAKNFMGLSDMHNIFNEFFGMILQWKLANFTIEVAEDVATGRAQKLQDTINSFQYIVPLMVLSTLLGQQSGKLEIHQPTNIPLILKPFVETWVAVSELILSETQQAAYGTLGLTSFEYTFVTVKLALFLNSLIETDNPHELEIDEAKKQSIAKKIKEELVNVSEFERQQFEVQAMLARLSNHVYNNEIYKLSLNDRAKFYCEMLDKIHNYNATAYAFGYYDQMINYDTLENLKIRFKNRYLIAEYSALWRVPVLLSLYTLAPLRALFRYIFYNNSPVQQAELDQLWAHDKILLAEWPGATRNMSYQSSGLLYQTVIFLMQLALSVSLVLPLYSYISDTNFFGNLKAFENFMYAAPNYLLNKFGILENKSFVDLASSVHQGTICRDVEGLAAKIKFPLLHEEIDKAIEKKDDFEGKRQNYLSRIKKPDDAKKFALEISTLEHEKNSRSSSTIPKDGDIVVSNNAAADLKSDSSVGYVDSATFINAQRSPQI